jgi:simple sugar transport system permease protein
MKPKIKADWAKWLNTLAPFLIIVVIGLFVSAGLIYFTYGIGPLDFLAALFRGAYGTPYRVGETIVVAVPLLITGLGVAIAFSCGFWNIGVEGQLMLGAIFAVWAGFALKLPSSLHVPLLLAVGFAGGVLWVIIPAILRLKLNVNEILTTLMFNFIALWLFDYVILWPFDDPAIDAPQTYRIFESAILPQLVAGTRAHAGMIIAIIVAVIFYFIMRKTSFGYQVRVIGANPKAALYGGVHVSRTTFMAVLLSAGLAGLAGAIEVSGVEYYLHPGFRMGYGYIAIAIALLGQLHPVGVALAAVFFGTIWNGAAYVQRIFLIPIVVVELITGLFILLVLLVEFIQRGYLKLGKIIERKKIPERKPLEVLRLNSSEGEEKAASEG